MSKKKTVTTQKAVAGAIAAATIATSCAPSSLDVPQKTIRIQLSGVMVGDITKTDPSDIFAATAPATPITLTLQSKTVAERRYTVQTGEDITVPLDTYTVTGAYAPFEEGKILSGAKVFARPPFSISGEIVVCDGEDTYLAPASYDCAAIILDATECPLYKTYDYSGNMVAFPHMQTLGSVKVAYVSGSWSFPALTIQAMPEDPAEQEAAVYQCVSDPEWLSDGVILIENGKWYKFSPKNAQTASGGITTGLPEWQRGGEEEE